MKTNRVHLPLLLQRPLTVALSVELSYMPFVGIVVGALLAKISAMTA